MTLYLSYINVTYVFLTCCACLCVLVCVGPTPCTRAPTCWVPPTLALSSQSARSRSPRWWVVITFPSVFPTICTLLLLLLLLVCACVCVCSYCSSSYCMCPVCVTCTVLRVFARVSHPCMWFFADDANVYMHACVFVDDVTSHMCFTYLVLCTRRLVPIAGRFFACVFVYCVLVCLLVCFSRIFCCAHAGWCRCCVPRSHRKGQ